MSVEAAAVTPLTDIGDPKPDGIGLHIWREGQDGRSLVRTSRAFGAADSESARFNVRVLKGR